MTVNLVCGSSDARACRLCQTSSLSRVTSKVLDDEGREVPIGQVDEICIRGPQVMKGYWNRPDETAKVITKDGWLGTGDMGFMDARGCFKITDRKKDMIVVSGFKVFSNEIEDVLKAGAKAR